MDEIALPDEEKSSPNVKAGRKSALDKNPLLYEKIEEIITQNGDTYGDPEKPLRWTTWSLRKIASKVDENQYECGKKITEEQKENLNIEFVGPNEKWNYIIRPNR